MLSFLAKNRAQICLLRLLVSSEYLDITISDPQFVAANQEFRALAKIYGRYVDFLDLPMNYDGSNFLNQDHLNDAGTARFAPLAIKACFDDTT
jgi:hypothetical protein